MDHIIANILFFNGNSMEGRKSKIKKKNNAEFKKIREVF
jgi:hypothetical protein